MVLLCNIFCQGLSVIDVFLPNMIFLFYHKKTGNIKIVTFLSERSYNTHQVKCYHFFIIEIIAESVNLILMQKLKLLSP